jgi:hypothetical protein
MDITDITADDALTVLARLQPEDWAAQLTTLPLRLLREMADLCGVGAADTLGKRSAIKAIVENF